ncbi:recombinase family protein [Peribacillus butanolivorans]|uniref:recombinase family protein n=1 Tax=Peribacillus butanolivorans TaxID=421767 RepID=UPI00366689D2
MKGRIYYGERTKIGYARVSSKTQNVYRQIKDLNEYSYDKICIDIDIASGRNFERPEYQKVKQKIRFDAELIIHSLSRFGRNKEEILKEWKKIIELKARYWNISKRHFTVHHLHL